MTSNPKLMVVVSQVPLAHRLIQTIQPIRSGRHQSQNLLRHIRRDKVIDRMTDEHIRHLDPIPEEFPDLFLGASGDIDQITSDLDVRAVDDLDFGASLADQWNQAGHLRVVDDYDVGAVLGQGPAAREPVPVGIEGNPFRVLVLLVLGESRIRGRDSLEDVVIGLCDSEDSRTGFRDMPVPVTLSENSPSL